MANSPQAKKRARQAENNRVRNGGQRSNLRTFIKKVLIAVKAGDKEQAVAAYKVAESVIDSAVTKGIIHKNKAARGKSRLNLKVKNLVLAA
ncbi:MAG: 30S ribosomal protein S20 [Methylococcales bacterium]|jgi:small subunit ribosomal protein S20|nr:30S ribosomal protein S20 [Methylococcales bacterium]MCX7076261.1 30S ribosomal protein S20 [Methylococcales bacterium]